MCDMLHDAKFRMIQNVCYVTWGKICDILHDAQCVTCYMTQNVCHVTCNKEYDVLHTAKNTLCTPTNQTLNEYIHPDITGCLSSYSWIFIHLAQLIQWIN